MLLPFLLAMQASARLYVVTTTNDSVGTSCLRGAINSANAHGGNDVILLKGEMPRSRFAKIPATAYFCGGLEIKTGQVTIISEARAIIDASNSGDRVFHVFPNARLTLQNLIVTGGKAGQNLSFVKGFKGQGGGGILNEGSLVMDHCVVAENAAGDGSIFGYTGTGGDGGDGGGINIAGVMTLNFCLITNNSAGRGSRGDFPSEGLVLTTADAGNGGGGGNGGGIYNSGSMLLNACVFKSNQCGNGGNGGDSYFSNSGNGGAGGNGGGICNEGNFEAKHCQVMENVSGKGGSGGSAAISRLGISGSGGNGGVGGGIANVADAVDAKLFNCLVALNAVGGGGCGGIIVPIPLIQTSLPTEPIQPKFSRTENPLPPCGVMPSMPSGSDGFANDLFGSFYSRGFNLIAKDDFSSGFINGNKHDIVGTAASPANPTWFKLIR
jgi:hypothetical protein